MVKLSDFLVFEDGDDICDAVNALDEKAKGQPLSAARRIRLLLCWLDTAAELPGDAGRVAIKIACAAKARENKPIRLQDTPLCRQTVYHCVDVLEDAGLISTSRARGCKPLITIKFPTE